MTAKFIPKKDDIRLGSIYMADECYSCIQIICTPKVDERDDVSVHYINLDTDGTDHGVGYFVDNIQTFKSINSGLISFTYYLIDMEHYYKTGKMKFAAQSSRDAGEIKNSKKIWEKWI